MRRIVSIVLAPVAVFVAGLATWEGATRLWDIPAYLLPPPSAVAAEAWDQGWTLLGATAETALGAGLGFASSLVLGALIAFAFSQSPIIRRSFYPYAIFLQTVPIIAIAPLIVIWIGTGRTAVAVASAIVSLFPIVTNGTAGLTRVEPGHRDLFALYSASRWDVLWKLRLPGSVPYFVAGAKVSSGLSVIGAIVGEFFAGSTESFGLGYLIILNSGQLKTARLFAAILASTLLGLVLFGVVGLVGELILRVWRARSTEA